MTSNDQEQARRLGKYTIANELGRGGFATVYLAHDTVLRRDVALKLLHPQLLTDPAFVTRFENDAHATAQLDHPRIAAIYDLGHHEGRMFMAIQLMAGGSLADRIKAHGRLAFAEAVRVIEDVAQALDYAHASGFIHRDVKPSNILFNGRGDAILSDFGLVKVAESSVIARTTMGGLIGTPAYMAPEIWEGKNDSHSTDVYALGCVLFEMVTGELLFKGATPPTVMLNHFQPHRYPEQWPADTPAGIETVLERALARDQAARYASAGAFAADVRALMLRPATSPAAQQPDPVATPAQAESEAQALAKKARQAQEWRDAALQAERAGGLDIARVAGQQWLKQAPDSAEAQAFLLRIDDAARVDAPPQAAPAGEHLDNLAQPAEPAAPDTMIAPDAQAARRTKWLIGMISTAWVVGSIACVVLGWAFENNDSSASIGTVVGWAAGWAIGGLLAGIGLRMAKAGGIGKLIWLTLSWPLCMTAGFIGAVALYNQQPDTAMNIVALGSLLAGSLTGAAILGLRDARAWAQVFGLGLCWALGWIIAEANLGRSDTGPWHIVFAKIGSGYSFHALFQTYRQLNVVILSAGAILGAAAGALVLWLSIRNAARRF
jgi:hypothetical protein